MIQITDTLSLEDSEVQLVFIRASGPGGQNVNKVATAVQLRFDVRASPSLPDDIRQRLSRLAGNRLTHDGVLILNAQRFRTQDQNRRDALDRLARLIRQAIPRPRSRLKTTAPPASKRRRLQAKRRRGEVKRTRRRVHSADE